MIIHATGNHYYNLQETYKIINGIRENGCAARPIEANVVVLSSAEHCYYSTTTETLIGLIEVWQYIFTRYNSLNIMQILNEDMFLEELGSLHCSIIYPYLFLPEFDQMVKLPLIDVFETALELHKL